MPMQSKFEMVKDYLMDLGIAIVREDPEEEMVVVSDPENGIHNLVIDCEDPILIMEQLIMEVPEDPKDLFENLLKMNRALVHGAFALDESGEKKNGYFCSYFQNISIRSSFCGRSTGRSD